MEILRKGKEREEMRARETMVEYMNRNKERKEKEKGGTKGNAIWSVSKEKVRTISVGGEIKGRRATDMEARR